MRAAFRYVRRHDIFCVDGPRVLGCSPRSCEPSRAPPRGDRLRSRHVGERRRGAAKTADAAARRRHDAGGDAVDVFVPAREFEARSRTRPRASMTVASSIAKRWPTQLRCPPRRRASAAERSGPRAAARGATRRAGAAPRSAAVPRQRSPRRPAGRRRSGSARRNASASSPQLRRERWRGAAPTRAPAGRTRPSRAAAASVRVVSGAAGGARALAARRRLQRRSLARRRRASARRPRRARARRAPRRAARGALGEQEEGVRRRDGRVVSKAPPKRKASTARRRTPAARQRRRALASVALERSLVRGGPPAGGASAAAASRLARRVCSMRERDRWRRWRRRRAERRERRRLLGVGSHVNASPTATRVSRVADAGATSRAALEGGRAGARRRGRCERRSQRPRGRSCRSVASLSAREDVDRRRDRAPRARAASRRESPPPRCRARRGLGGSPFGKASRHHAAMAPFHSDARGAGRARPRSVDTGHRAAPPRARRARLRGRAPRARRRRRERARS